MEKKLKKIKEKILKLLEKEDKIREESLRQLREISRDISTSIKNIHYGNLNIASEKIEKNIEKLKEVKKKLKKYPEIYYHGFLHQTEKEVIEAKATLTIIEKKQIPDIEDFDYISYLHGICEAIGEIRRYVLDKMRSGEKNLEEYLEIMDKIYFFLLNFPYPDAITRSLRRQIDNVRGIIEKTRGEITVYSLINKK